MILLHLHELRQQLECRSRPTLYGARNERTWHAMMISRQWANRQSAKLNAGAG